MRALLVITLLIASLAVFANGETTLKSLLIKNQVSQVSEEELKDFLQTVISIITNPTVLSSVISLFGKRDLASMDEKHIQAVLNHLISYLQSHPTIFNQLLSIISGRSTMTEEELRGFWDSISNAVNNAVNTVGNVANQVGNAVGSAANQVGNAIGTAANQVGNAVGNAAGAVGNFIQPMLPDIIAVVTSPEVINTVLPAVISLISLAGKRDLSEEESKDLLSGLGTNLLNTLINYLSSLIFSAVGKRDMSEEELRSWLSNLLNDIKPQIPNIISAVVPALISFAGKRDIQEQEKFIADLFNNYIYMPVIVPLLNYLTSAAFSTFGK